MRSYGVQLLAIAQDVEKLRGAYPNAWGGFLGNAEAVWWMSTNHTETIQFLGATLGAMTRREAVSGMAQVTDREIATTPQLAGFLGSHRGNLIVTRSGDRALRLKNASYFTELPVFFYARDPNYPEARLRALMRALFSSLVRKPAHAATPVEAPVASAAQSEQPRDAPLASSATAEAPYEAPGPAPAEPAPTTAGPSDADFVRIFEACFGEQGSYPNRNSRRTIVNGFSAALIEGGSFEDLQLRLEKWATANMESRSRAEDVIEFFEDAVRRGASARA
jgi:hypothetical protein